MVTRLLLVEDERAIADAVRDGLASDGYQVTVAGDGVEALIAIENDPFDLAALDVMLPGMDGFELCRRCSRHATRSTIGCGASTPAPTTT